MIPSTIAILSHYFLVFTYFLTKLQYAKFYPNYLKRKGNYIEEKRRHKFLTKYEEEKEKLRKKIQKIVRLSSASCRS